MNVVLLEMIRKLMETLHRNRTIDRQKTKPAKATMRKMLKRPLKKYRYCLEKDGDVIKPLLVRVRNGRITERNYH